MVVEENALICHLSRDACMNHDARVPLGVWKRKMIDNAVSM
jgi:hypothetical protein